MAVKGELPYWLEMELYKKKPLYTEYEAQQIRDYGYVKYPVKKKN